MGAIVCLAFAALAAGIIPVDEISNSHLPTRMPAVCLTYLSKSSPSVPMRATTFQSGKKQAQKQASWPQYDSDSDLWQYCVPYNKDIQKALDSLRRREFEAGRFYLSKKRPKTIDEAIKNGDASATRSILDMETVSRTKDMNAVSQVPAKRLRALFHTDKPTHAMIENASKKGSSGLQQLLEEWGKGEGLYIITYSGGKPSEIYFAGWSF